MRIAFVHYNFGPDGVTRVVLNNVKGIKRRHPNFEIVLAGSSFQLEDSDLFTTRTIEGLDDQLYPASLNELRFNAEVLYRRILDGIEDADLTIVENPTIGIYPMATVAYKMLAESNRKNIAYRVHDQIEDRSAPLNYMKMINGGYEELVYPEDVKYLFVNSDSERKVKSIADVETHLIPNSVVEEDFKEDNHEVLDAFRKQLIDDEILKKDQQIVLYPVRICERKNVAEAILNTALLSRISGDDYKLIVTMREDRFPRDRQHRNELETVAQEKNIDVMLGGINKKYHFFGDGGEANGSPKYDLKDLFGISDIVMTTSMLEGFGYCFLEPFLAEKPLIGRSLDSVVMDMERNGVNLSNLYPRLNAGGSDFGILPHKQKLKVISSLNEQEMERIIEENDLQSRFYPVSDDVIRKNRENIISHYNYVQVADALLDAVSPHSSV